MILSCIECGKRAEGTTGLCATHNKLRRVTDNVKLPDDPKPIKKVSDTQGVLLRKYGVLKKKFMLNKWCAYHGKPCLPTDIHHSAGKVGVDENGVPMLLAAQYFVPLCREAHSYIETHPRFAKENGYSESRLVNRKI
jgi:hypothetical protein